MQPRAPTESSAEREAVRFCVQHRGQLLTHEAWIWFLTGGDFWKSSEEKSKLNNTQRHQEGTLTEQQDRELAEKTKLVIFWLEFGSWVKPTGLICRPLKCPKYRLRTNCIPFIDIEKLYWGDFKSFKREFISTWYTEATGKKTTSSNTTENKQKN